MNKKVLVLAISSALLVPVAAQAVDVKISGQVNRAIMNIDNGNESDTFHVDNDNSSTRFRFVGSEKMANGNTVGLVWESQFESNTSASVDVGQNNDGSAPFSERKMEAYFSGNWGKVSIGQGDGAANGTSEVDLSGTSVISYSDIAVFGGGVDLVDSAGNSLGVDIGDVFRNYDGLSRNDRLRYDTPAMGGFKGAISATNGDAIELAGRYSSKFQSGKLAAAVGYVMSNDRGKSTADLCPVNTPCEFDQLGLSISYLHNSGFNATVAYGTREFDDEGTTQGEDADYTYAKLGYKAGKNAFSISYGQSGDQLAVGADADSIAISWVGNIHKGVELYAIARNASFDSVGTISPEDIRIIGAGTRVKF